ncbi:hypothetical protein HELRODRAFT_193701 [Helobdella robusta]|uniref:Sema domain-containing protein n=1 Tax=Helobdella robusta TaxID=6412 RepID=T1FVA0_HELRO|nr:hypothetical protein HELRODRAFT_193701 [Helobdella robusta]ESN95012.1 hypothetical protein HELRODRAFT_193701 [Helobdella robusta]
MQQSQENSMINSIKSRGIVKSKKKTQIRSVNLTSSPQYETSMANSRIKSACTNTSDFRCTNQIQFVYKNVLNSDQLIVCGTGSMRPLLFIVQRGTLDVTRVFDTGDYEYAGGFGVCSPVPYVRTTSLIVEYTRDKFSFISGTPTRAVESRGVVQVYYLSSGYGFERVSMTPLVAQPEYITYISSFAISKYVYIFSREIASEMTSSSNPMPGHYARVIRVCQNERGIEKRFLTLVKMRLTCFTDANDLSFNYLRDVHYEARTDEFHALFSYDLLTGSKICRYKRSDIDSAFLNNRAISPIKDSNFYADVEIPRPLKEGQQQCTLSASDLTPDNIQTLVNNQLIGGAPAISASYLVLGNGGRMVPNNLFGVRAALSRTAFTRFVVEVLSGTDGLEGWIYWCYDASNRNYITRVYVSPSNQPTAINAVCLSDDPTIISNVWDLKIQNISGSQYIYITTDTHVLQLNAVMCGNHNSHTTCTSDPHCFWGSSQCRVKSGNIQSSDPVKCSDGVKLRTLINGLNGMFSCSSACSPTFGSFPVWFLNDKPIFNNNNDDAADVVAYFYSSSSNNNSNNNNNNNNNYGDNYYINEINYNQDPLSFNNNSSSNNNNNAESENMMILNKKDFTLRILNATFSMSGKYECRDAYSSTILAQYQVSITEYCKLGSDFERTWIGEFKNWCDLYDSQRRVLSCCQDVGVAVVDNKASMKSTNWNNLSRHSVHDDEDDDDEDADYDVVQYNAVN